jgi:hypothetical protein
MKKMFILLILLLQGCASDAEFHNSLDNFFRGVGIAGRSLQQSPQTQSRYVYPNQFGNYQEQQLYYQKEQTQAIKEQTQYLKYGY